MLAARPRRRVPAIAPVAPRPAAWAAVAAAACAAGAVGADGFAGSAAALPLADDLPVITLATVLGICATTFGIPPISTSHQFVIVTTLD